MPRERELQEINAAWTRFIKTEKIDREIVRPEIAASWIRCHNSKLDPLGDINNTILDHGQLQRLLLRKKTLVETAEPIMNKIYQFVAGSGFIVMLSDEQAYVMEVLGDAETFASATKMNLIQGASWREEEVGTNGIGTALAMEKPVQVSGAEHYCQRVHPWTCSASPITDDSGTIIGALQMSGPSCKTHLHTLGIVVAAVAAIEGQLRIVEKNRHLLLLNNRLNNIFLTVSDGVLVVSRDGSITQINPVAEKLLSKSDQEIRGTGIRDIIERSSEIEEMLDGGRPYNETELLVTTGSGSTNCLSSGKPIMDEDGMISGGVIFLKPLVKIKNLVNRFSGAHATFTFSDIVGQNKLLLKTKRIGMLAADSKSNILLQGESGTGKELMAQAIHNQSGRRSGPFVAVNCGAIPRELVGSELFGYEEGAFTGAQKGGRPGKFELAAEGTLFLDEIGDMPLEQQVALLRVLQDRQVTRIGGHKVTVVDVRIICASNKNLQREVERGNFRKDLFYRLNVITINLPPLRQRREDIPLLFDLFLKDFCGKAGGGIPHVNSQVMGLLQHYDWPGNIREFHNVVERMVNIANGMDIGVEHLPDEIINPGSPSLSEATGLGAGRADRDRLKELLAEHERQELISLLLKHRGNISRVAQDMGLSRNTVYRKLNKLNIPDPDNLIS